MERTSQTTTTMTQQNLRRKALSSSSTYFQSAKKNPLHPNKDGRQRTDNDESSSTISSGAYHRKPVDNDVAYFPDQVARVSYIASVVRPEADGKYVDELQGGMKLLATRLAPSYFPGTIVRQITTQVDGYHPSVCPSTKFDNCQDVTASIGVYLGAVPGVEDGRSRTSTASNGRTTAGMLFEPSAMTEELLAFEESLNVAIANNELQAAIQQEYLRNDIKDTNPGVVIVTDTVKSWDFGTVSDTADLSSAAIGMSVTDPSISNASIASIESPDSTKNARLAAIGITGTVLFSVMLVMWLAGGRKRSDYRRTEEVIVDIKEKIRKHHRNRHSKTMKLDEPYPYMQTFLNGGDEEEGFTGGTMCTVASDSNQTSSPHKRLLHLVATSSKLASDSNFDSSKRTITVKGGADDEDDNQNDFVLGEDDDSEGSVGQHLLSVSRSSECRTPQSVESPTPSIEFFLDETVEETIESGVPTPSPPLNFEMQGIVAADTEDESLGGSSAQENVQPSKITTDDSDRSKASTHGSDANNSSTSIMDDSSDGRSMTRSVGTSISQKEKIEEIRSQVVLLVRDVAPDEEQNVDEMIRQFKSREEELLETLLGMKEKIIARKARIESQTIAKRNAIANDTSNESTTSDFDYESSSSIEIESDDSSSTERQHHCASGTKTDRVCEDSTRTDNAKAAADAAAWAIQRSLDEMIEREREEFMPNHEQI